MMWQANYRMEVSKQSCKPLEITNKILGLKYVANGYGVAFVFKMSRALADSFRK